MAVQYTPIPEFQVPNINFLGAMAQGEASRLQEIQAAKAAQAMELQGRAAQRQEEESALNARTKLQELNEKIRKLALSRLDMIPEGDQENYLKTIGEFKDIFPSEYEVLSKRKWDADTRKMVLLTPEQQYAQAKPVYKEYGGEVYKETPQGLEPAPILPVGGGRGQAGAFNAASVAAPAAPTNIIEQAKQGVARVESGGNYGAIGPAVKRKDSVDHAYGKYQVMGANIPSWTKQALGKSLTPREFLDDKDAQEAVFEDQFKRNIAKYGSLEDAVSVWFSGRPLAQATKAGARDVNMGVQDYVSKVMGGAVGPYQTAKTAPMTGEAPSLRNVPVNAFTSEIAPTNTFAAQAAPAPQVDISAGLTQPRPQTPIQPLTVGTKVQVKGQSDVDSTLGKMLEKYNRLDELKAIPSSERGFLENLGAYTAGTTAGQEVEKIRATPAQRERNELKSLRRLLLKDLMKATGASAKELDSNFELKSALESLSDETMDIDSVRRIMADLSARYGGGGVAAPKEKPAASAPPAVSANAPRVIDFSQLPKRR
jgi:hypothetical protein